MLRNRRKKKRKKKSFVQVCSEQEEQGRARASAWGRCVMLADERYTTVTQLLLSVHVLCLQEGSSKRKGYCKHK
jgi:hypothetical protein